MATVALHDSDAGKYPNLALTKFAAWHKSKGDKLEKFNPLMHGSQNTALPMPVHYRNRRAILPERPKAYVLDHCPFKKGQITLEGDRMPDPVLGF